MTGPTRDRRGPNRRPPKGGGGRGPNPPHRAIGFWLLFILLLFFGFQIMLLDRPASHTIFYSEFQDQVDASNIEKLSQNGRKISGSFVDPVALPDANGAVRDVRSFEVVLPTEDGLAQTILDERDLGDDDALRAGAAPRLRRARGRCAAAWRHDN